MVESSKSSSRSNSEISSIYVVEHACACDNPAGRYGSQAAKPPVALAGFPNNMRRLPLLDAYEGAITCVYIQFDDYGRPVKPVTF